MTIRDLKKALYGVLAFIVFMFIQNYASLPLTLLNIDVNNMSSIAKIIYMTGIDIILMIIIYCIFKNKLKQDFKDMKKNYHKYFKENLKYWLIAILIMLVSNYIIILLGHNGLPDNEQGIETLFKISPLYVFFAAVIEAPFVEELIFRQGFRNIFKTNWLFIIMSGLIFGGMHVFGTAETLTDLLYIIPYGAPGCAFAYMLCKNDNIFIPMGFHFLHNGILVGLQFILLIFG